MQGDPQNRKKKQERTSFVLSLMFLLAALFFLDLSLSTKADKRGLHPEGNLDSGQSEQSLDIVNRHLQNTQKQININEMKARNELFSAPKVGDRIAVSPERMAAPGVPMNSDRNEIDVMNDLKKKKSLVFQTPNSEIQGEIRDNIDQQDFQHQEKIKFAQEFIENARRNGLEVILNEDLVVISVRKLGPESKNRFDPSASGSQ